MKSIAFKRNPFKRFSGYSYIRNYSESFNINSSIPKYKTKALDGDWHRHICNDCFGTYDHYHSFRNLQHKLFDGDCPYCYKGPFKRKTLKVSKDTK